MILDSDTNTCFFSKLLLDREDGFDIAARVIDHGVTVRFIDNTRDIWARDYMPVQIDDEKFLGYEYAPDYLYYDHYASFITNQSRICNEMSIPRVFCNLILDGGNIVKTSRGVIMVEKIFHENPLIPKKELVARLEKLFESQLIILPWDKAEKYGHADGIAREISPGRIILTDYTRYSKKIAQEFERILSAHFEIETLKFNVRKPHVANWCYINFLQIGKKVFLPQLTPMKRDTFSQTTEDFIAPYRISGKEVEEDNQAFERFRALMPDIEIIPVSCPQIVKDGGALNCISWNIKTSIF